MTFECTLCASAEKVGTPLKSEDDRRAWLSGLSRLFRLTTEQLFTLSPRAQASLDGEFGR